jgi:hypothetical protein
MVRIRSDGSITGSVNNPTANIASGMWSLKDAERSVRGSTWPASYDSLTDPYFANTSLLVHADGTNISNNSVFIDSSPNIYTVTRNGNPGQGTFTPFPLAGNVYTTAVNGGSSFFNGSTDYFSLPNLTVGTNNFTIEGWFYAITVSSAEIAILKLIGASNQIEVRIASSKISGRVISSGTPSVVGNNTTISPLTWYHFALVRNNNVDTLYLNGVAETTTVNDTTNYGASTTFTVAANQSGASKFNGWLSNIRVNIGTAVYTGNFTVPTSQLSSVSNTQVLLNFTNANILDYTAKNNLATIGNVYISTTQSKFGGSSVYFSNTGGGALVGYYNSSIHSFNLTDFTVEAWVYPLTYTGMTHGVSNIPTLIGGMQFNSTTADWSFGMSTSGILKFYYYNGSAISINTSTTVPLNTWSHIAAVKTSAGITMFYNGTLVSGPTAISGTPSIQAGTTLTMGAHNSTYMNAYLDDVRITKYARYTADFAVPTLPFQDR